jgi:hypothetical protein
LSLALGNCKPTKAEYNAHFEQLPSVRPAFPGYRRAGTSIKELRMAEEQVATRKDHLHDSLIWTKIFGGFRVALDPKKLLLAAAGILVMSIGWWLLACLFYNTRPAPTGEDKAYQLIARTAGPNGSLSTFPWFEDRGPNPFLLVEKAVIARARGEAAAEQVPLVQSKQFLVLIEPLVKFLSPVIFLFHPDADFWCTIYFFLVILWTLATWALFGAAITRMAAVQVARNEKIGMTEAVRFAWSRYVAFFSAPIFPLVLIAVLAFFLILYGLLAVFTVFIGDIFIYGLLWPIVIIFGLIMAVVLVGLVGWPMMYATISTEGSDSFDALSRSYSYVYQAPWHYLWYSLVAVVYGAVGVFFIGLMGSLTIYLGKWGVSQAPFSKALDREQSYLFVWAPTSFGWRDLLLTGSPKETVYSDEEIRQIKQELKEGKKTAKDLPAAIQSDIENGTFTAGTIKQSYWDSFHFWNYVGAFLVAFWLYLIFLLVVGFGYSYFWSASEIIYLLMRRKVDDTELDEVHLEEEETEEPYTPPPAPTPAAKPEGASGLIAPESLTLRTPPGESPAAPKLDGGSSASAPSDAGEGAHSAPPPESKGGDGASGASGPT